MGYSMPEGGGWSTNGKGWVKFRVEYRVLFGYDLDERGETMPNIIPVSDLKNYSEVLGQCENGAPVYLTKNGRGRYVVQSIEDYQRQLATIRLLSELAEGMDSMKREGALTVEEAFGPLGL